MASPEEGVEVGLGESLKSLKIGQGQRCRPTPEHEYLGSLVIHAPWGPQMSNGGINHSDNAEVVSCFAV